MHFSSAFEPVHEIIVLITSATSEVSGEPAHMHSLAEALAVVHKYGSRRRVQPQIGHLAPLDGCARTFE